MSASDPNFVDPNFVTPTFGSTIMKVHMPDSQFLLKVNLDIIYNELL